MEQLTAETDGMMHNHHKLNRAIAMQKTVKTIPRSVNVFLLAEQALIEDILYFNR